MRLPADDHHQGRVPRTLLAIAATSAARGMAAFNHDVLAFGNFTSGRAVKSALAAEMTLQTLALPSG
jgi:hypothetical protein